MEPSKKDKNDDINRQGLQTPIINALNMLKYLKEKMTGEKLKNFFFMLCVFLKRQTS